MGSATASFGASKVGRRLIPLLRPFDVDIVVADPYLTEGDAGRLGVGKVELPDLMRTSDVISIHAPAIPATHHMIDADLLALIKDDAVLVNNARAAFDRHRRVGSRVGQRAVSTAPWMSSTRSRCRPSIPYCGCGECS